MGDYDYPRTQLHRSEQGHSENSVTFRPLLPRKSLSSSVHQRGTRKGVVEWTPTFPKSLFLPRGVVWHPFLYDKNFLDTFHGFVQRERDKTQSSSTGIQ